ncbi:MAG: SDR family NAD(P)-dependent oxidoreductase [Rhizobiaceae bacterium]
MADKSRYSHRILITGATDGIGFQLARAYALNGHAVLATGRRAIGDDKSFFDVGNITYIMADQIDPKQCTRAISKALEDLGWTSLDLAILNAATAWTGNPRDETAKVIDEQISVNLTSQIRLASVLAPLLFAQHGRLVMVGSTATDKSHASFATYSATKAGLDGFCRSLREEWRGRAQVMIVHPGPTRTRMHQKAGLNLGFVHRFFMSPRKVARAIQTSIRRNNPRRSITPLYLFASRFSWAGKGRL